MKLIPLKQIAEPKGLIGGPFGSSLVSTDYSESGVPVIRGVNMSNGRYVGGEFAHVSEDKFVADLSRNSARGGDIVYTQRGTLGQVALLRSSAGTHVISQSQMRLRVDEAAADPLYVYYASTSPHFRWQIGTRAISTGVPHINLGILGELEIPLLPLPEQRAIAATLSALDDKIESNRRVIELVPQIVRAQVSKCLAGGGESVAVSSLARFVNGGAFTKGASGTGRMVIRIAELNSGPGGSTVYNDIEVPEDKTARPGDILMSWSGSLGVYRWSRDEAIINQHIFKVLPTGYPDWLVYDRLDAVMHVFRGVAADKATTMGHIKRGDLDRTNIDVPLPGACESLSETLTPLWGRLLVAEQENLRLATLRDALLPELLSGRIRVPFDEVA